MAYRSIWAPSPLSVQFRPGLRSGALAVMTALLAAIFAVVLWPRSASSGVVFEVCRDEGKPPRCALRLLDDDRKEGSQVYCSQGQQLTFDERTGLLTLGDWEARPRIVNAQLPWLFPGAVHDANQLLDGTHTGRARIPMDTGDRLMAGFPTLLLAFLALCASLIAAGRLRALETIALDPPRAELTSSSRSLLRRRKTRVFPIRNAEDLCVEPRVAGWSAVVLVLRSGERHTVVHVPEKASVVAPHLAALQERLRAYVDGTGPA